MDCPKCGLTQSTAPECRGCGIIIDRYRPNSQPQAANRAARRTKPGGSGQSHNNDVELLRYYESMGQLLSAGIAPSAAQESYLREANGLRDSSPYQRITQSLADGHTISFGMNDSPGFFPRFQVAIVQAAEQAGTLPEAFRALSLMLRRSLHTKAVIAKALRKPAITLLAAVFVLPVPTLFAAGPVAYLIATLPLLLILVAVALVARAVWRSAGTGRYGLKFTLIRLNQVNQFARVFHTLYRAGISAADAWATAARTCKNSFFRDQLMTRESALREGMTLAHVTRESNLFPPDFEQVVGIGEVAGALDSALEKYLSVAEERFETELGRVVTAVTTIIGIAVLVFVGYQIIAGFTALLPGQ